MRKLNESRKVLVCTMLTDDFENYAKGAFKMGLAVQRDLPLLKRKGIHAELGILEMQVSFCVPPVFVHHEKFIKREAGASSSIRHLEESAPRRWVDRQVY